MSVEHVLTARLRLDRPGPADLDALFALNADPRVWTHYPSLVHTRPDDTAAFLERWDLAWRTTGLGTWVVRARDRDEVVGYGGATLLGDAVWNIGYRLAPERQGRGLATELARAAMTASAAARADLPRIAYLVAHNAPSARVAEKLGMTLVHRGPDADNPDPGVDRLVYADRPLTSEQLAVATR